MDPIALLLQLAFYLAFAGSLWRWLTRRGPLELAVVAVFAPIAALFLLSLVNGVAPTLAPVVRPLLITLLFLQPLFVVHLVDQIRPVSGRISVLVLAGCLACTAGLLAFTGNAVVTLAAVVFFFGVQTAAAGRLALDSQRRTGVARVRLGTAALATLAFGSAVLLAGAASAAAGSAGSAAVQVITRGLALAAGIGYLLAFVPPAWLRRPAYRLLSYDLMRHLAEPVPEAGGGRLWTDLAESARQILGARRVTILAGADGPPLASIGEGRGSMRPVEPDGATPTTLGARLRNALRARPGLVSKVELPLRSVGTHERLIAEVEGRALFVEDDLALLSLLGSLTARAVDREEALISLGATRGPGEASSVVSASEARFRALLEADPNAILALDDDLAVIWATRQAGVLFGGDAQGLVGMALADLIAVPRELRAGGTRSRPVARAATTGRRLDGTHFPAEVARSSLEMEGQRFELVVVSDVTWRAEEAQVRERFLGVLSHELRTPVTSIYGGTQLLLSRGSRLDEATRTELLVSVAAESERLQRMIENLVALARIERGAEFLPPRPVLVDRVVRDLIERERQLWPDATIQLTVPHPVQMAAAEDEYLGQIVRNLLSNAVKYSGPGSTIEVEVTDREGEVVVLVRDNGPGIDAAEADKLFSLYYRAAHQAAAAPGAGIGLFICRELVTLMGGRIWAHPRPGGGAEFGFSLPTFVEDLDEPEEIDRRPLAAREAPAREAPVREAVGRQAATR